MASYYLQTQVLIAVAVTLHNYIKREAHMDCLFEKYSSEEMIVIDIDNDGETSVGYILSYIDSEMDWLEISSLIKCRGHWSECTIIMCLCYTRMCLCYTR